MVGVGGSKPLVPTIFNSTTIFMIKITLPDGKQLEFAGPISAHEVAKTIGPGLAKDAIAAEVNDKLVDLSFIIENDASISILTPRVPEGLEILRHSAAHVLAQAVCELFPGAEPTVGPAIEDGFYHDFYYPQGFTEQDLVTIENKMHEIVKANYEVERSTRNKAEAIASSKKRGKKYEVLMLEDIPTEEITFYRQGSYLDACRGPHVPNTAYLKAFKLTKLSGAYWKGDSNNQMLQRIYGTAWATEKELKKYLERIEKAKQNDHRLLGKKMDLFHLQEEAPGIVFWHPNGWTIYSEIKRYLSLRQKEFGYEEVNTPIILDRILWEKSGHWDNYRHVMFTTESENRAYAVKPMNCPGQIQIFKQGVKSYRDLPIRYCEFGYCHRNEVSGSLHGIMRVRGFTQDDGHIFCTEEQLYSESEAYIPQVIDVYAHFGFKDIIVKLATRPKERIGEDALWDKAEHALSTVLDKSGVKWQLSPGEGAFYGPKIEFSLRDSLGRIWQCGTLQVDFFMPKRFDVHYISEKGEKQTPVMLHRAMIGSLERFIGILIEETGGHLPLWLAPIQGIVVNITDDQGEYAQKITKKFQNYGIRVNYDLRNEKIGFKIREHSIAKVPFILVVGNKEQESETVSVRSSDGKDLGQMSVEKVITDVMKLGQVEVNINKGGVYQSI
jgi:threonyl-tRNA synthetase